MERYICVHAHFYQPPRENPWLEAIEHQDSAFPYHDWNAKVTDECYEPNSTSRILDADNRISEIVNNYAKISCNFGPTLMAWMEEKAPEVYHLILEADKESQKTFSGHGSALAQVYNHLIMPLANPRDRRTQVIWGVHDFRQRFGRQPEGMWLSETAVDLPTLEALAEQNIKFTILAQHQASHVRAIGAPDWEALNQGTIDPSRAYQTTLPSGKKISLFFYDGPISRAVAFEGLLNNGEDFAKRLASGFSDERKWPQLMHIATDGESYGHHHRNGDMALAYALNYLTTNKIARLTNYGEYLEKYPPEYEVRIVEKSSWSCPHGVDRWWRNCGCNSGGYPGWTQEWRTPLRQSLDYLREQTAPKFEKALGELMRDPWEARNDYVSVIIDRSPRNLARFFGKYGLRKLSPAEKVRALSLLELQRHAMLMYTSCGWFFDELSGLETVQVIQYAGRVAQLHRQLFGDGLEEEFLKRLQSAKSNIPEQGDGRQIYEHYVKTTMIDLIQVGAHYAISSLFEEYGDPQKIFCYSIDLKDYQRSECGKARLAAGRMEVCSKITREAADVSFGVLHFGDHNLNAGVRAYRGEEAYNEMTSEITRTCSAGEFAGVIRLMDKHFGVSNYSIKSLFRDEQRRVLEKILTATLAEIEAEHRKIFQANYPLMRFLLESGNLIPRAFRSSARLILNSDLRRELAANNPSIETVNKLLSEAKLWKVGLGADLGYIFRQTLERKMDGLTSQPWNADLLGEISRLVALAKSGPLSVGLRKVQNSYYRLLKTEYHALREKAKKGEAAANSGTAQFDKLGQLLGIKVV
jgi:alpha-amylase/alpha-mannosidase (GH57 family)